MRVCLALRDDPDAQMELSWWLEPAPTLVTKLHERIEWVQRDLGSDDEPASLQGLADKAGVTRQVLQQWVTKSRKGLSPGRGETFTRCARAWNVSLEWLQSGKGEPRSAKGRH